MKRLISVIGSIIGVIFLIALLIFAFTMLRPQNSPSASQILGQEANPYPELPTQSKLLIQGTEIPAYPPPPTYNEIELPKITEAATLIPTSYPLPTITPTPVNLPTQEGPLPPGLKMVYAETDGKNGITNIWLVNIADLLKERKLLATIKHKERYGVYGEVSPDGNKIAYEVIPPNTSTRAARTHGSEIWVMNADGSEPRMIAAQMGYVAMWSLDSKSIIAGRWMPTQDYSSNVYDYGREEFYLVDVASSEMKLLIADEKPYDIYPAGWSSNGQVFYYVVRTALTSWELWAIDISTGETYLQIASPIDQAELPVLSPDGNWLLFPATEDGRRLQIVLSIDGKQRKDIPQNVLNNETQSLPITLFSANSQNLLFSNPAELDQQPNLEKIDINKSEKLNIPIISPFTETGNSYDLCGWSPDEKWAIVREYPKNITTLYFIKIDNGEMMKMPATQPFYRLYFFGWINQ